MCMVTARPFVATASHGLRLVYLLTRFVLVFMDEDIAPGLPRRPPGRRGGGYCCRMVGSDPLVAVPAAGFVAAAHNLVLAAAVAPRAAAPSVRKGLGKAWPAARPAACWRPCELCVLADTLEQLQDVQTARCRSDTSVQMWRRADGHCKGTSRCARCALLGGCPCYSALVETRLGVI